MSRGNYIFFAYSNLQFYMEHLNLNTISSRGTFKLDEAGHPGILYFTRPNCAGSAQALRGLVADGNVLAVVS